MLTVRPCFVLISDDALLAHALSSAISDSAALNVVPDGEQALALIQGRQEVMAIVIDQCALRADALRLVSELRRSCPLASLLWVASKLDVSLLNALQPLRAQVIVRPLPSDALAVYVARALVAGRITSQDMAQCITRLSRERRPSAGDRDLIPLVLGAETPELACARLSMDRGALERGMRRIVKKCRVRNTDRLARTLWRDALLASRDNTGAVINAPKMAAAI